MSAQPITPQQLAEAVLKLVRDVGAPITGAAIGDRLAREPEPIKTSGAALIATLDALVERGYLTRALLTGQRSTYRIHEDCPAGPVRLAPRAGARPALSPMPMPTPTPAPSTAASEPAPAAASAAPRGLAELILDALADGKRLTPAELSTATKRKANNVYEALNRLRKAGLVYKPDPKTAQWAMRPKGAPKPAQAAADAASGECRVPCGQYPCDTGCVNAETAAEVDAATPSAAPPVDYYAAFAAARQREAKQQSLVTNAYRAGWDACREVMFHAAGEFRP